VSIYAHRDLSLSGNNDILADTLNYEKLRDIAHDILMQSPHDLIESLAEEIAKDVLLLGHISKVEIILEKPDIWGDSIP
jgi:dihydroneopterin aldolase